MKNLERNIYLVIILILVGVIISGIFYIVLNNKNDKEVIDQKNDGVKLVNTKKENDKIIQEYEIVLNGKKHKEDVTFTFEKLTDYVDQDGVVTDKTSDTYLITAKMFDMQVLYYRNRSYENNNTLETVFNEENITKFFSEKNFEIVKGVDNKNYLIVYQLEYYKYETPSNECHLKIFNDDLEIIKTNNVYDALGNKISDNEINDYNYFLGFYEATTLCEDELCETTSDFWYKIEDKFNMCDNETDCQIRAKVENNKIYVLMYINDNISCAPGTLEEREYTINDNKLEYKVINKYKIKGGAGAC